MVAALALAAVVALAVVIVVVVVVALVVVVVVVWCYSEEPAVTVRPDGVQMQTGPGPSRHGNPQSGEHTCTCRNTTLMNPVTVKQFLESRSHG